MGMGDDAVFRYAELVERWGRSTAERLCPQVTHGIRSVSGMPPGLGEFAAALMCLYPDAVFCGWSAARLHRHMMAMDKDKPVELWTPAPIRRRDVLARRGHLEPDEVVAVGGLRCTDGTRTAIDLARFVRGDRAIAAMDQCLRHFRDRPPMTTPDDVLTRLSRCGWRSTRVREILAEADGRAESPWETYTRLLLHRDGLTGFVPQIEVYGGRYRLDLGDQRFRVGIEYQGAWHGDTHRFAADIERLNVLENDLGWHVIQVTVRQVRDDREAVLRRVRAALERRGWVDPKR